MPGTAITSLSESNSWRRPSGPKCFVANYVLVPREFAHPFPFEGTYCTTWQWTSTISFTYISTHLLPLPYHSDHLFLPPSPSLHLSPHLPTFPVVSIHTLCNLCRITAAHVLLVLTMGSGTGGICGWLTPFTAVAINVNKRRKSYWVRHFVEMARVHIVLVALQLQHKDPREIK